MELPRGQPGARSVHRGPGGNGSLGELEGLPTAHGPVLGRDQPHRTSPQRCELLRLLHPRRVELGASVAETIKCRVGCWQPFGARGLLQYGTQRVTLIMGPRRDSLVLD